EADGEVAYDFRLEGTATAMLAPADLPAERFAGLEAVHFGSFAVALLPSREAVLGLARSLAGGPPLTLDPNGPPGVVADRAAVWLAGGRTGRRWRRRPGSRTW